MPLISLQPQDGKTISQILAEHDIPYYAMSNAISILAAAYKKRSPGKDIGLKIEQKLLEYNTEQTSLIQQTK